MIFSKIEHESLRQTMKDKHKMAARAADSYELIRRRRPIWSSFRDLWPVLCWRVLACRLRAVLVEAPATTHGWYVVDTLCSRWTRPSSAGHDGERGTTATTEPRLWTDRLFKHSHEERQGWTISGKKLIGLGLLGEIVLILFNAAQVSTIFCVCRSVSHSLSAEEDSAQLDSLLRVPFLLLHE